MAGGCGDNEPVTEQPPGLTCDAAWHDFQHGTELDDQLWGMAIDAVNNVYLTGYEPSGDSHGVVGRTLGSFPGFTIKDPDPFDEVLLALDPSGHVEQLVQQGDGLPRHPARPGLGVDLDLRSLAMHCKG